LLAEPRYSSINSGLLGWVVNSKGDIQWRSTSSELLQMEAMPKVNIDFHSGTKQFFHTLIDEQEYYAISYDTTWDVGIEHNYRFIVMHSRDPMRNELEAFQKRLWKWLGGLAIILILVQTLIAKWSLRPLNKLASDLKKVEEGQQQQLSGHYPAEIQPVTDNLNRVLSSEQIQRERYRNTLSDLAHSLKTPLAVIRGHLHNVDNNSKELTKIMDEQVSRMSSIVEHQLRRANAQVSQTSHTSIFIKPIIQRLTKALDKVYQHKKIRCVCENISDTLSIHCDEADFMELFGNLIDNAYKYGYKSIRVTAKKSKANKGTTINIEDDGPGIPDDVKQTIITRGTRADTATPGQGIGLSVTVDILSSYGGSLDILKSNLGGASFIIYLPDWKK
jgi:two-component system sensor histidine kinase PhoQ